MLRCLGVLGAPDPYRYQISGTLPSHAASRFQRGAVHVVDDWARRDSAAGEAAEHNSLLCDGRLERPLRYYVMEQLTRSLRRKTKAWMSSNQSLSPTPRVSEEDMLSASTSSTSVDISSTESSDSDAEDGEYQGVDLMGRYTIVALLRLLSDPAQNGTARSVGTQALLSVLRNIGSKSVVFAPTALPALLNLVANSPEPSERTRLLTYMAQLIFVSKEVCLPFLKQVVCTLDTLLDSLVVAQRVNASMLRSSSPIAR